MEALKNFIFVLGLSLILGLGSFIFPSLAMAEDAAVDAPSISASAGAPTKLSAFPADESFGPFPRILEDELGRWELRRTQYFNIFSEPGDRSQGEFLAESVDQWLVEAMGRVGMVPGEEEHVDLFILPSAQAFIRFSNKVSRGGEAPAWAVGLAFTHADAIFVKAPRAVESLGDYSFAQTTVHEIGHIVLGRAVSESRIPRWLHEGLAKFIAGETTWEGRARLSQAVLTGSLIPLRELNRDFPRSASGAALAYAQSLEFLGWMMDEYGPEVLQGLIQEMGRGTPFDESITALTGQSLYELEDAWHRHLRLNFAWLPALTTGGGLWVFASIILVLGYWRKRRERTKRRARWAIEEALIYGPDPAWNSPAISQGHWLEGASTEAPSHLRVIEGGLSVPEGMGGYGQPGEEEYDDDNPPPGGWVH